MDARYSIHFNSSDDLSFGAELPDYLEPNGTLDSDIDRIAKAIRGWILDRQKGDFGHLTIAIDGPIGGRVKPAEERLAESTTPEERFYALGDAAKSRFNAGDFVAARTYALELQKMTPTYREDWNYGNAIASVNIVLGRLALREGRVEEAEAFLLEAGKSPGSPQMDSFGPNMSLALDLLNAGRPAVVLEYFEQCATFWSSKFSKLDHWREDVQMGRTPNFGANLVY